MKLPKLEISDPDDIRQIIAAAYDLLDSFGVMVDNEEALQTLENVHFVTGPLVPNDIPQPLLDSYRHYLNIFCTIFVNPSHVSVYKD